MYARVARLSLFVLIVGVFAGCGGGAAGPVEIPVYPGAEVDTETFAGVQDELEAAFAEEAPDGSLESEIYSLPEADDPDEVFDFYNEALSDALGNGDLQAQPDGSYIMTWGENTGDEAVVIIYAPDAGGSGQNILMTIHGWE